MQDGRIKIKGKDEIRKRLGGSPDRGDALALAQGASAKGGRQRVRINAGALSVGPNRDDIRPRLLDTLETG